MFLKWLFVFFTAQLWHPSILCDGFLSARFTKKKKTNKNQKPNAFGEKVASSQFVS